MLTTHSILVRQTLVLTTDRASGTSPLTSAVFRQGNPSTLIASVPFAFLMFAKEITHFDEVKEIIKDPVSVRQTLLCQNCFMRCFPLCRLFKMNLSINLLNKFTCNQWIKYFSNVWWWVFIEYLLDNLSNVTWGEFDIICMCFILCSINSSVSLQSGCKTVTDTFNAVQGQWFIDALHGLHWDTQTALFALFLYTRTHTHTPYPVFLVISAVSKHRLGFCHPLWQSRTQQAFSLGRLNMFLFKIW